MICSVIYCTRNSGRYVLFFLANMGGGMLSDSLPHYAGAYIRKNAGVRGTGKKLEESGKKLGGLIHALSLAVKRQTK